MSMFRIDCIEHFVFRIKSGIEFASSTETTSSNFVSSLGMLAGSHFLRCTYPTAAIIPMDYSADG